MAEESLMSLLSRMMELGMPDLRNYYRMTKKAKVVASYPADGQYFVDVQPLRNDESPDEGEPVVPHVAVPVIWGGPNRGVICPPTVGTMCDLSYYDGDPNYPFISNIRWGLGQSTPNAELNEFVIQLEPGVEIRIDKEKKIITLTPMDVNTEAGQTWTVKAGTTATVEAPQIILKGNVTTTDSDGGTGTVEESANRTQKGSLTLEGPFTINGTITANGDINCSGNVDAASRSGAPI